MFFLKEIALSLSILTIAATVPCAAAEQTANHGQVRTLAYDLLPEQVLSYEGKVFETEKNLANALDGILATYPDAILRLEIAQKEALKIFTQLLTTNMDDRLLTTALTNILAPAKKFLSGIMWASNYVIPVLQESLIKDYRQCKANNIFPDNIILLRFFSKNNANKDLDSFFTTQAKSPQEKLQACSEFLVFFKDLRKNLSPQTYEAYKKFRADLARFQKENTQKSSSASPAVKPTTK